MIQLRFAVFFAFLICSAADLFAVRTGSTAVENFAKPLLMPLLIFFYWISAVGMGKKPEILILLALFCGFLGDTFLLLHGGFFLLGLGSFLLGHLCYILAFLKPLDLHTVPPAVWVSALAYLAFAVFVSKALLPSVQGREKIAVVLYMACLLFMSFSALLRCGYVQGKGLELTFIGSLFFVASDSMLAFQIYRNAGGVFHVPVMVTYLLAQSLIVFGVLQ